MKSTFKDKVRYVLERIQEKRELTVKGKPIQFEAEEGTLKNSPLGLGDFFSILEKLEAEAKVLTILTYPGKKLREHSKELSNHYQITLGDNFDYFCYRTLEMPEDTESVDTPKEKVSSTVYSMISGNRKIENSNNTITDSQRTLEPKLLKESMTLRFDELNRYILLDECFIIAQPDYDSENYRFFEYMSKNPNRTITLAELNKALESPLKKPFSKILDNLNFRGALKDAFFKVSKTSVCFTPTRSIAELKQAGLFPLRLYSTQKSEIS